jgi:GT2 family glycosyltransferase
VTATLSVSLVVFRDDLAVLRETVHSLAVSLNHARSLGVLCQASLSLVDNGNPDPSVLDGMIREVLAEAPWVTLEVSRGHGNVGYGRGHNLAILPASADYHLVLNPDVVVAPDAIAEAMRFLEANPDVGLIAPDVRGPDGERQYLARRYPSVFMLFLRGFAPGPLRRLFRSYMENHELRPLIGDAVVRGVPTVSGCFMFARGETLRAVGGFSPDYFLYFEDYDLSVRMGRQTSLAFVPTVRITHAGGNTAGKGLHHIRLFVGGAAVFFRKNGWKLA